MTDPIASEHKAGFVSIVGKPNVGKSTLMNALVGENLSIITSKAQTTRHRIKGIINGEDFQVIYSDTPGIIAPKYELQQAMMRFVDVSLDDADVILWVVSMQDTFDEQIAKQIAKSKAPLFLLLNKIDLSQQQDEVTQKIAYWQEHVTAKEIIPISALKNFNTEKILQVIIDHLPVHPPYFPKDELTDKSERFFAAEILREKIFLNYDQEIPYCCEVQIIDFKQKEDILVIQAEIWVERDSQKSIVIGKEGSALKKVGTAARKEMENFFGRKVFLEQRVKVNADWRSKPRELTRFGYLES